MGAVSFPSPVGVPMQIFGEGSFATRSVTRGSPAAGKIWVEVATITVPGSSRARAAMRLVLPPEPTTAVSPGTISRALKSLLTPLAPADGHDVIGRGLVDDIVEP